MALQGGITGWYYRVVSPVRFELSVLHRTPFIQDEGRHKECGKGCDQEFTLVFELLASQGEKITAAFARFYAFRKSPHFTQDNEERVLALELLASQGQETTAAFIPFHVFTLFTLLHVFRMRRSVSWRWSCWHRRARRSPEATG